MPNVQIAHIPEAAYYTSLLRDLGSRVLFVFTQKIKAVGAKTSFYFLVEEGQIRVEAVVRHAKPGRGLRLQFTAVRHEDPPPSRAFHEKASQFQLALETSQSRIRLASTSAITPDN